jgi:hypothetical protein
MPDCTIGPKYCPKCGKELDPNGSVCNYCEYEFEKEKKKIWSRYFRNFKKKG